MEIIHKLSRNFLKQEIFKAQTVENVGFLTANKRGDFASFFNIPSSRYQGWFFRNANNLFKIVEDIAIAEKEDILTFKNEFWRHTRVLKTKKGIIQESFFLPENHNALVYELNQASACDLFLDYKAIYNNSEEERTYTIEQNKKNIIIECKNQKEKVFLAIKTDESRFLLKEEWIKRSYGLDIERNSPPYERYVFLALSVKAQKMVLAVGDTKKHAIAEANYVFHKTSKLKEEKRRNIKKFLDFSKIKNPEISMAYYCAQNGLRELKTSAGLPWFFESWARDTFISMKALFNKDEKTFWKTCFQDFNQTADSAGWLFKRIGERLENKKVNEIIVWKIRKLLEKTLENLDESISQNTWMDSIDRTGERIELQALKLYMLKLAFSLTKETSYKIAETALKFRVKEKFWNGKFLKDGLNDETIRPNIFLAYYIYPELLEQKEWQLCFDNALNALWLPWGGVATIDKNSSYFNPSHTGENPQSYHSGDSWFFLNNLTAIVLRRNNPERYRNYIDKIIEASAKEILTMGTVGCHTELSSASHLSSQGCWSQAWSNAMFVELVREFHSTRRT